MNKTEIITWFKTFYAKYKMWVNLGAVALVFFALWHKFYKK